MPARFPIHASDVRGLSQLVTDGVIGVTDLVEALHAAIVRPLPSFASPKPDRTAGISGLVYRSVRGVNRTVAGTLDFLLTQLDRVLEDPPSSYEREAVLAALNGVLGDTLSARGNPLAISMGLRSRGCEIPVTREALAAAYGRLPDRIAVMVHGLCMNDLQWGLFEENHDDDEAGPRTHTPLYVHYNTGLHTSANGRSLADLLEEMRVAWPVQLKEIVVVTHSMGGLVARSAVTYGKEAGYGWPRLLTKMVFLGTPHHGAPLERGGNWIDQILGVAPYSAPFSRLGKVRSAGITDLRHGNLFDEDWQLRDRFAGGADRRRHEPLPDDVRCYAVAATISNKSDNLASRTVGDGLVPVDSALGRHADPDRCLSFPQNRSMVACGVAHLGLLSRVEIHAWVMNHLSS